MRPTGSTFYYFFFTLLLFSSSYAQVFPVQGSLQITPPYSPYLSDYTAAGTQKITLQLRSNDIALSDHPIRLRFSIEGVGISIRTKPGYIPPAPHTLMGGGAPTLFYGEDLLDYFSPDNLDFAGFSRSDFQKSAKLPEGVYRFSFEVFDYYRQVPLSSKITMVTWIVLNDPPLLNLPLNQAKVSLIDPVNIAFTWTPRHTASPNAAFSTEYVFKLVEIWPANRNPYDAFLSQTPLYETTTTESQLIYGPAEPALITGRKYAWQVQARDENGRDIFKNQGKSEVFVFQFGDGPGIPENLHKQSGNTQTLTLLWEAPARGVPDQYNIRYKTAAENKWSETLSDQPWVTLTSLQANTDYDVQVRSKREDLYSDYTAALRVKTDEKAREFTCGQPPPAPTKPDKTSRLLQLTPGDVFTCSDWRIVVTEVTRSDGGEYAGKGMMAVKMFNGASVEVAFHGAINADYQLVTGGVESTYKKDSEMGKVVEEMHKIGEKKKDTTKTNIDSLPLPQLQELAQSLIDIPQKKIDNATVLNREEKQQINGARTKAKEALKTLNDPKATDKEKKEAEKNLRKAVADAKPAMDKLTNSSNKDKQAVADRWFKNIMDFLNAYKGNETGKKQAIVWHNRMDSMVNALSKKTGVPNDLMKAMLDAHQNAKTAWASLEKGTDGIRPKGPSANFEEGYTPEDIALCKENVKTAEAVEKYVSTPAEKGIVNSEAGNYMTPDKRLVNLPAGAEIFYNCENESLFQNTGYLYKFRADNKIWQAAGTAHLGSGFQFEQYTSGGKQYTIGTLAREGDDVWQVTQTFIIQNQRTLSIQKRKLSNTTAYSNIFEKSDELSEEKSISVTTKCDNKPNSNAATDTTTIPDPNGGRYVVKVYLQNGKWQAQVTLKGNPNNKTSTQKEAIEAEMNKEISEKLNELEGLNGKRSKKVTQSTEDGGEFWVKDMNGLEWLHTIGNLGSSVWEYATVPQEYWNKDKGYEESTVHLPPTFAGVSDGAVEKITEFPQLVKLAYDVTTKEEVRTGLWNSVKNISPESIKKAFEDFYEEKKANYTSDKRYIVQHTGGKDAVIIAFGALGALSLLKDAVETTGQTIKKAIQKKLDDLKKYFDTEDFAKRIKDRFSKYKGKLSKEEYIERYKTLHTNREIGKLTEEQFKLLEGGVKPSKGIATSDGRRYFDNVLDGTAREVKSGPVTLLRHKEQILKDIEIIDEGLAKDISKIEWHCFDKVERNVVDFIKQELKTRNLSENLFVIKSY